MTRNHRTLSIVIPVHNQASEIGATLSALDKAILASSFAADIVVVDDGSTDGTVAAAKATDLQAPLRILQQKNLGRLEARRAGVENAGGTHCLLLDSRVQIAPHALRFLEECLDVDPGKEIWNAHVEIEHDGNPYGVFWDVITSRAYWAYFGDPRTTSFGLEDFDHFPKGTTCFFAPRELLLEAFAAFRTSYSDVRNANDDAPLIRWLAARQRINISPLFGCTYPPRRRLVPFLRHAFHRGTVFVDGHGNPDAGWFPIVIALFGGSAACVALAARKPLTVIPAALATTAVAGAAAALSEARPSDAPTMAWVTPLYATAHIAGMWRGLYLSLRGRSLR